MLLIPRHSAAAGLVMLLALPPARAQVVSTFDAGAQGWLGVNLPSTPSNLGNPPPVVSTVTPTFNASGGNPGGFISMTDVDNAWLWYSAPSSFLGNQSAAFGGSISFDLRTTVGGPDVPPFMLVGNGLTLYAAPAPAPATSFTAYSVPLLPANFRVNDYLSGPPPTAAELQGVLGNLSAFYVDHDWFTGTETTGLDNVRLAPVPEPGSLIFLGLGGGVFAGVRWRGRRPASPR